MQLNKLFILPINLLHLALWWAHTPTLSPTPLKNQSAMAASAAYLLLLASLLAAPFLCLSEVDLSSVPIKDGLSWTFYKQSCPKIESIIRKQLQKELKKDIGLAAALLRIHFHDCFVQVTFLLSLVFLQRPFSFTEINHDPDNYICQSLKLISWI